MGTCLSRSCTVDRSVSAHLDDMVLLPQGHATHLLATPPASAWTVTREVNRAGTEA